MISFCGSINLHGGRWRRNPCGGWPKRAAGEPSTSSRCGIIGTAADVAARIFAWTGLRHAAEALFGRTGSGIQVFKATGLQPCRTLSGPEHLNTRTPEHRERSDHEFALGMA